MSLTEKVNKGLINKEELITVALTEKIRKREEGPIVKTGKKIVKHNLEELVDWILEDELNE